MRNIPFFCAILLWVAAATGPVVAGDEFVTLSDGRTLVLHDNYTWDVKGSKSTGLSGDVTVNVYGDKNIVLHEDRTWDFVGEDSTVPARPAARLKTVSATATASRQTLDDARDAARTAAIKKIAQQLKGHADSSAVTEESLERCIGLSAVFVTLKQARSRDKGSLVSLKATLSKAQIDGVLSCAAQPAEE